MFITLLYNMDVSICFLLKKLTVFSDNIRNILAIINPFKIPNDTPRILSIVFVIKFSFEILPAVNVNIR